MSNLEFLINNGINVVVGTTGFDDAKLATVKGWLAHNPAVGVLIAPNFAIGAVLMMEFAEKAARYFESAEIIELHHPAKVDAPSGTAARTAELMSAARKAAGAWCDARFNNNGARWRTRCISWRHSSAFCSRTWISSPPRGFVWRTRETLTIRHDSIDRAGFMPGVILGVRKIINTPGLTHGLDKFM